MHFAVALAMEMVKDEYAFNVVVRPSLAYLWETHCLNDE